ncbi:MAG TPA: DUF3996 domain-containing protein [Spirochaetota bacterium]|nr:DUF3996 domain-containing protein [Spirochaetota bacterium]HOM38939.1 DUF3996 domain-containing protein [Spirochaetota bacterium]HPQ49197.1 DUF3996 domain-containing protein [Spirochaetota bacterium]
MKKRIFILILTLLPLLTFSTPEAGIIIGNPTGLSFEYVNIQVGVGWDIDKYFNMNIDYLLFNKSGIISGAPSLGLYAGLGGAFQIESNNEKSNDDKNKLGIRIPLGIFVLIKDIPLRIFLEVAPTMYLIESTSFGFGVGLGIRYVF